jgi:hypothetical protein
MSSSRSGIDWGRVRQQSPEDYQFSMIVLFGLLAATVVMGFVVYRYLFGYVFGGTVNLMIVVSMLLVLLYALRSGETRRAGIFFCVATVVACIARIGSISALFLASQRYAEPFQAGPDPYQSPKHAEFRPVPPCRRQSSSRCSPVAAGAGLSGKSKAGPRPGKARPEVDCCSPVQCSKRPRPAGGPRLSGHRPGKSVLAR